MTPFNYDELLAAYKDERTRAEKERTRADAAEARADRLAAALLKEQGYADEVIAWIGRGDKARARQQAYYARDVARFALADSYQENS